MCASLQDRGLLAALTVREGEAMSVWLVILVAGLGRPVCELRNDLADQVERDDQLEMARCG
jgi:hypothetical protein